MEQTTMRNNDQSVPQPKGSDIDRVEEASQESFPASDPPSWTCTGEKGSDAERSSQGANPAARGCATSFVMQERGELGGICDVPPDPSEQYVQPEKEREAGGEG